jgi:hypothetical protein
MSPKGMHTAFASNDRAQLVVRNDAPHFFVKLYQQTLSLLAHRDTASADDQTTLEMGIFDISTQSRRNRQRTVASPGRLMQRRQ